MTFRLIPHWSVTAENDHASVTLTVSEDDLEAVVRALKRSGYTRISQERASDFPNVTQVAS